MLNKEDIYSFGQCGLCRKIKPLKNTYCVECEKEMNSNNLLDSLFGDIFGGNKNE